MLQNVREKMNNIFIILIISFNSLIFSQEVFEGYTLFTPGGGGGGATTYLKDNNLIQKIARKLGIKL